MGGFRCEGPPNATNDRRVIQVAGVNDAIYRACDRRSIRLRHGHCRNRVDVRSAVGRAGSAALSKSSPCSCRKGLPANPSPDCRQTAAPQSGLKRTGLQLRPTAPGTTRTHRFQVSNVGLCVPKIAYQPVCKSPSIPTILRNDIELGGSTEIEVNWTPFENDPRFAKTVTFWTNDPDRTQFQKPAVRGKVIRERP